MECLGMSTFFRGISETVLSLFCGNFFGNEIPLTTLKGKRVTIVAVLASKDQILTTPKRVFFFTFLVPWKSPLFQFLQWKHKFYYIVSELFPMASVSLLVDDDWYLTAVLWQYFSLSQYNVTLRFGIVEGSGWHVSILAPKFDPDAALLANLLNPGLLTFTRLDER